MQPPLARTAALNVMWHRKMRANQIIAILLMMSGCGYCELPSENELNLHTISKLGELKILKSLITSNFEVLKDSCSKHTLCFELESDSSLCNLPASWHLLNTYLPSSEKDKCSELHRILSPGKFANDKKNIINSVDFRTDTTIIYEVRRYNNCTDSAVVHSLVYQPKNQQIYDNDLVIKKKLLEDKWTYYIISYHYD